MRKLSPRAFLLFACLYATQTRAGVSPLNDTVKINHAIDGSINEWKIDSFETDKDTQVQYAVDHDGNYLYVAVKIADQRMQMKMMTQGMNMYIDRKGKHREGTGINFPLQQGMEALRGAFAGRDPQTPPDPKAMREALAKNMILLKIFGFEDQEDKTQMVVEPGGVNVSYDWDEANNMYIEYLVPMQFIGKNNELNGKPISIGWQLMSVSAPSQGGGGATPVSSFTQPVSASRSGGSGSGASRGGRGSSSTPASEFMKTPSVAKEQIFWKKHTLSF